jgi:drug/metabolite transporter (DMT)-like permease
MNPRLLAYFAVFISAFAWALSPIFMRFLSVAYDPYTQALARYIAALAVLLPYSLLLHPQETRQLLRRPWGLAGLAALNVLNQVVWTIACYHTTATSANLITKIQVAFVIVFSFILFREERGVIRSPLYLGGTLLGVAGVVLFVTAQSAARLLPRYEFATMLLIAVALGWAVYAVWGKHLVMNTHPVPMFTVVALLSTLGFAVVALLLGDVRGLWQNSMETSLIVFLSGVFPIAVAHCTFHYGQKHLGSAFTNSFMLVGPLITYVVALMLWQDEKLVPVQWLGAVLLLLGSYLVVQAQRKKGLPQAPARLMAPPE